jgi:hypothetical protein
MSEGNEQSGEADRKTIRARADFRYLARTSPPIPDALMQEAHRLIEADRENPKDPVPPSRTNWPPDPYAPTAESNATDQYMKAADQFKN